MALKTRLFWPKVTFGVLKVPGGGGGGQLVLGSIPKKYHFYAFPLKFKRFSSRRALIRLL